MKAPAASALLFLLLAGCASAPPQSKSWTVRAKAPAAPARAPGDGVATAFAATRLGAVSVDAPYDRPAFAVLRADGSIAHDPSNAFAAAPSALLRAPVRARLAGDGRFGNVVGPSSVAAADAVVETTVTDLSLDCATPGRRAARVALSLDVVNAGRGPRKVVLSGSGSAEADAASGDYGAAFSSALDAALSNALESMK